MFRSALCIGQVRFGEGGGCSNPKLPVEGPVLDGLGDVLGLDAGGAGQIGDGAGDLQDAVVGPGAEMQFADRHLEHVLGVRRQGAVFLDVFRAHRGVAVHFPPYLACRAAALERRLEALLLDLPRRPYPLADRGRGLAGADRS